MRHPLGCATWFGAMIFVAMLTGCASAPQYRYYTIDMQQVAQIQAPVPLDGVTIKVNEALARPEILVRTSSTQIEYYALDRWASGLEEQVAEKLKTEFAGASPSLPGILVRGTLMAFEQVDTPDGAEVRIKLDVHAYSASASQTIDVKKLYTASQPMEGLGAAAAVEALSRAMEAIAKELAVDLAGAAAAQ